MTKPIIIDTETTGLKMPQAVEVAYITMHPELKEIKNRFEFELETQHEEDGLVTFNERFKPSKAIEEGASRTHGIYMKDLLHCRPSKEFELPKHTYFIAHNANYDHRVLGKPETTMICTLQLARLAYDKDKIGLANHKLTTLIAFLYKEEGMAMIKDAHGALEDCKLTYYLILKLLEDMPYINSWADMAKLCKQAKKAVVTKMPFGKHRGIAIGEVPRDYLQWLMTTEGLDDNLATAIQKVLKK